jgi:16S rRNA U516 pseudouridylate synthase RsuA-like enzyme
VAAGLGRTDEALGELEAVKNEFIRRRIPFDAALVTLEIAALHLQEGRTAEVKRLAREIVTIFKAQKVHREAIATVQLFREAAEREAVDQEAIRELLAYLQRARQEPGLRLGTS